MHDFCTFPYYLTKNVQNTDSYGEIRSCTKIVQILCDNKCHYINYLQM